MATVPAGTDPSTAVDPFTQLANFFTGTAGGRANGRLQQALLDLQQAQLGNQQYGQASTNATAGGQLANNQFGQESQNATAGGQLANNLFGQESTNALNQAQFGLAQPNALASQAVRGDILANAQDANVQAPAGVPMGTVTGGLRPSLLSASTRELGGNMARNALLTQMKGPGKIDYPTAPSAPQYPTAPSLPTYPTAPGLPQMPQASGLDTALNVGGAVSGGLSALNNLLGSGSGGSGNLGPVGSALKSGLAKLFGGGSGGSSASATGGDQGPGEAGANGGYYGPTQGGAQGFTPDEIAALTQYFGGDQPQPGNVGPGEQGATTGVSNIYDLFGGGGQAGMGGGGNGATDRAIANGMTPEEIAALGGLPQDPSGWGA